MPDWDDTDYSTLAVDYANVRRPDPRIGAQLVKKRKLKTTNKNTGTGKNKRQGQKQRKDEK